MICRHIYRENNQVSDCLSKEQHNKYMVLGRFMNIMDKKSINIIINLSNKINLRVQLFHDPSQPIMDLFWLYICYYYDDCLCISFYILFIGLILSHHIFFGLCYSLCGQPWSPFLIFSPLNHIQNVIFNILYIESYNFSLGKKSHIKCSLTWNIYLLKL